MCGIAGYVGPRKAVEVVYDQLKRLEYRGYDSAGIAFLEEGGPDTEQDDHPRLAEHALEQRSRDTFAPGQLLEPESCHQPPRQTASQGRIDHLL